MKLGIKKIVAREFLAIVGMVVSIGIIYLIILALNYYYQNKVTEITNKITEYRKTVPKNFNYPKKYKEQIWLHTELNKFNSSKNQFVLWKRLNEFDFYTKNFSEFTKQFSSVKKQKKLHDYLIEEQIAMDLVKSKFEDFNENYFSKIVLFNYEKFSEPHLLWEFLESENNSGQLQIQFENEWFPYYSKELQKLGFDRYDKLNAFINKNTLADKDFQDMKLRDSFYDKEQILLNERYMYELKAIDKNERNIILRNTFLLLFMIIFLIRYLLCAILWSIRVLKRDV